MAAMDDPPTPGSADPPESTDTARKAADVESGDRPSRRPAPLDRPPSERYATPVEETPTTPRTRALRALAIAVAGAALIAFLGGPLSMTAGLVAVAVVLGLIIGAVVRPASAVAVGLAGGSVILGLVAIWLFARSEGGVLDLPTYLADVQGAVAPLQVLVASLAAFLASR
jgi:hypothetical protein